MAGRQGDLELYMLNVLDASSHPALRDWAAGEEEPRMVPLVSSGFSLPVGGPGGYAVQQLGHHPY